MKSKDALQKLNCIPEGKPAWLDYKAYRRLKALFETLEPPTDSAGLNTEAYLRLHDFLLDAAGIEVPSAQDAVHYNAFVLLRRGYRTEEITENEYRQLSHLMKGTEPADPDDMDLHDFGNHRQLYDYLTEGLGVFVEAGRGPVWHRSQKLLEHHTSTQKEQI
jgi:hypothetical protein